MKSELQKFSARLLTVFFSGYVVTSLVQWGGAPLPAQAEATAPVAAIRAVSRPTQPVSPPAPTAPPVAPAPRVLPKIVAVDPRIAVRADELRPDVKRRLQKAAKALPEGITLLITSAYRTTAEQKAVTPTFGVKAKPGTSTHEDGRGIDLNVLVDGERVPPREQQEYIGSAMAEAGFAYLGAADPVHYSVPAWKLKSVEGAEPVLNLATLDEATQPVVEPKTQVAGIPASAEPEQAQVTE